MNDHIQTNGAIAAIPGNSMNVASTAGKHRLSETQRAFFLRQKQTMSNLEMGMRGALQMLIEEHGLNGKVTLSEDCSELTIEPEAQA